MVKPDRANALSNTNTPCPARFLFLLVAGTEKGKKHGTIAAIINLHAPILLKLSGDICRIRRHIAPQPFASVSFHRWADSDFLAA